MYVIYRAKMVDGGNNKYFLTKGNSFEEILCNAINDESVEVQLLNYIDDPVSIEIVDNYFTVDWNLRRKTQICVNMDTISLI